MQSDRLVQGVSHLHIAYLDTDHVIGVQKPPIGRISGLPYSAAFMVLLPLKQLDGTVLHFECNLDWNVGQLKLEIAVRMTNRTNAAAG